MESRTIMLVFYSVLVGLFTVSLTTSPQNDQRQLVRNTRTDDLTVQGLAVLVQQQGATIQTLNSQVASLQDAKDDLTSQIASLKTQLAQETKQVGFTVRFHDDGGQLAGVAIGTHSTLVFDDVITNVGNAYDSHTGIFTTPTAGLYSFFLTQMTADSVGHLWLSIQRDGIVLDKVSAHLLAGQKVWVRQEEGTAVRGSYFTVFTGYLVQAD